jgi:VanZ family protein
MGLMRVAELVLRARGSIWARGAVAACIVAITVLSLLPGNWQERSGLPGPVEHFIAYSGTGLIFAAAFPRGKLLWAALGLAAYSGLMELMQNFAPGRDPAFRDFLVSGAGALFGAWVGALIFQRK